MRIRVIAAGAAMLLGAGAVACTGANGTVVEREAGSPPPQTQQNRPAGPATSFTDGTFKVGVDIKAGAYKSTGPSEDIGDVGACYWERAKDDSGEFESIIANAINDGPGRVTVKAGEIFKTSGDCNWRLVA